MCHCGSVSDSLGRHAATKVSECMASGFLMHCGQTNACVAVLGTHIILYNIYCRMSCNSIYIICIYYDYETAGVVNVTCRFIVERPFSILHCVYFADPQMYTSFESITNLQRFDFLKIYVSPGGMPPPKKIQIVLPPFQIEVGATKEQPPPLG